MLACCWCWCATERFRQTQDTSTASQRWDAGGEYAGLVNAAPIAVVAAEEHDLPGRATARRRSRSSEQGQRS